jgi:hypothetical protein
MEKRKQSTGSTKLPMPNFDSDSADEFEQDRRMMRPSGKGKAGEIPTRSQYNDEDDDEEEEEDDDDDDDMADGTLEDDEHEGPGVAIWEEDEMEGMEEDYTDVESGDEDDEGSEDDNAARPSRGKSTKSSKDQMVSRSYLRSPQPSADAHHWFLCVKRPNCKKVGATRLTQPDSWLTNR